MKCSKHYRKNSVLKELRQSPSNIASVILYDCGSPVGTFKLINIQDALAS